MTKDSRKSTLPNDCGVSVLQDKHEHDCKLYISCAAENRSGDLPLKQIPDNMIIERAAVLESNATAQIEHLVSQVNAKLSHLRLSAVPVSASNFDKVERTLRILERMLDALD